MWPIPGEVESGTRAGLPDGGAATGGTSRCCSSAQAPRPSCWCTLLPPGRGLVICTARPQRPAGISQAVEVARTVLAVGGTGQWAGRIGHDLGDVQKAPGPHGRHPPPTGWVSEGPQAGGRLWRARLARHWLGTEPPQHGHPIKEPSTRDSRQMDRELDSGRGRGRVPHRVSQRVPVGLLLNAGL